MVCSNLQLKDDELVVTLAPPFIQLSEMQKNRQNFHSVHFTRAKDAKLELLCKIFIDKLTSESILYIDFTLDEYKKIRQVA